MATTCQQIYVRARQANPANAALSNQPAEILARIDAYQQTLFANLSGLTRDRFQESIAIVSSSAASARTFDLSALTLPVERVLSLTLTDGREAHQVDVMDLAAELSPRYIVRGETLVEVSNDWSTAAGAVSATLEYVYGPTAINPAGDYTQAIAVPDAWADLIVLPLQQYFAGQRPPAPGDELIAPQLAERTAAFLAYLTNYGGIASTRFDIPTPSSGNKKQ